MIAELFEFSNQNANLITSLTALAALFVSALSIVLTITALYIQRKHNYYSVKPIGKIGYWDYDRELVVRIRNAGIGPLRIDSLKIRSVTASRTYDSLLEYMDKHGINAEWSHYSGSVVGMHISPEGYTTLLKLCGDPNDAAYAQVRDRVREALTGLEVELVYSDIYDRSAGKTSRKLSWFGRHESDKDSNIPPSNIVVEMED